MPEGPEVRRIADVITKAIGLNFVAADIIENVPGVEHRFTREGVDRWIELQQKWQITDVQTYGKLIRFDIQTPFAKIVALNTLGMSGSWHFNAKQFKHARLSFITDDGKDLSFIDPRCYGTFRLFSEKEAQKHIKKIGWDLLKAPAPDELWRKFKQIPFLSKQTVGAALLSQNFFAGHGNIYRAEVLYNTKLNPFTKIADLTDTEWDLLNSESHLLLKRAYENGGTTVKTFEADGEPGYNQHWLKVYGRDECELGHAILKKELGKRTMWYCEECQINCKTAK